MYTLLHNNMCNNNTFYPYKNHIFLMLIMILSLLFNIQGQENRENQNMAELPPQGVTPSKGVVIIVLSIMFVITFILLLYVKFCRVTQLQLSNQNPSNQQNNRSRSIVYGVEQQIIETLPFFKFSSLKGSKQGLECTVCLSRFEDEEILRLLPKCKHAFHMNCIDKWLESHSTCPLCRYKVEEMDIKNFTFSFSSRFLRVPSNLSEDPNLEIFIQREPSQRKSKRFEEQEEFLLDDQGGAGSSNGGVTTKLKQKQPLHMINHKILISDVVVARSRWSDLNSSDLLSLNCEMLHDVSSMRFSQEENSIIFSGEKRCMSEIANVPRFVEISRRNRMRECGGEDGSGERLWRIWLPIARRTVQWFARQETNSVQLLQHEHLASNV
ncbi:E3 ubiquitin-protein ligase ATL42-like [Cicer arietinum]|uniref:RING-type E3 ubiquitin transferase n=1 Tax=Cicer arietinum TaxID=3827 RepID=A0A1S2Y8Q9_CICAR|nr:E3 ubiquitin-protein ligase ATL42-like [Cicer arietinum]